MQEIVITKKPTNGFKLDNLPLEDKQKLVGAFAWLIQEDKKQNPALYQIKKEQNDRHDMSLDTKRQDELPIRSNQLGALLTNGPIQEIRSKSK